MKRSLRQLVISEVKPCRDGIEAILMHAEHLHLDQVTTGNQGKSLN